MKGNLIYVAEHQGSVFQALTAKASFDLYGWNVDLVEGITPDTLKEDDFPYEDLPNGRFSDFHRQDLRKYRVKKSCLFNNLKFAQRVIERDEPMIFLEHDTIAVEKCREFDFDEYCFLSYQYAFRPPGALAKYPYNQYELKGNKGVNDFPDDYPVVYYHKSIYKGARQTPGTAAYALSPKGAKKILFAAEKGLEQSDYIINSYNLRLQYLWPSTVSYQKENLNLSHKL